MIHESATEPITGLGFREPLDDDALSADADGATTANGSSSNNNAHYLFIVTTNRVLAYQASGRSSGGPAVVVDEIGSGLGCATMDWRYRNMAVARDEAIYLCGTDGRGACYAYEGKFTSASCMCVHLLKSYLQAINPLSTHTSTTLSSSHHPSSHPQRLRPRRCAISLPASPARRRQM